MDGQERQIGGAQPPEQGSDPEIIIWAPEQEGSRSSAARWENLVGQIKPARFAERLHVETVLRSLPRPSGQADSVITDAIELAHSTRNERDDRLRSIKELLLTTLCEVLQESERFRPEELDRVLGVVVKSPKIRIRYHAKLKRGARLANEVAGAWAVEGTGDLVGRADLATRAILQGEGTGGSVGRGADSMCL